VAPNLVSRDFLMLQIRPNAKWIQYAVGFTIRRFKRMLLYLLYQVIYCRKNPHSSMTFQICL